MSHPRMLDRRQSALVVIDVQEAYRGKTVEHERMLRSIRRLMEAAKAVAVPILATEQYPKGLGHLVPEVAEGLQAGQHPIHDVDLTAARAAGRTHHGHVA